MSYRFALIILKRFLVYFTHVPYARKSQTIVPSRLFYCKKRPAVVTIAKPRFRVLYISEN